MRFGSGVGTWILVLVGLGLVVAGGWLLSGDGLHRLDVLLAGGDPLAEPVASGTVDHPYRDSPLGASLALEEALRSGSGPQEEVATEEVLAFADAIAEELGFWLLARTGASDVQLAEERLWESEQVDALVYRWAALLQERQVYSRASRRLSAGVPSSGAVYAHPDEILLLFAHAAWRLDLAASLVRSPVHLYVHLRNPSGEGVRGVEPPCFRRVDRFGDPSGSDERCQGPRLTFDEHHHPRGLGHIANPTPLPAGAYQEVGSGELRAELLARLVARVPGELGALAGESPAVGRALWAVLVHQGLDAIEADDAEAVDRAAQELVSLRAAGGVPEAPDEQVLLAAAAYLKGASGRGPLTRALRGYEPRGPVELPSSAAHAAAMWLYLEHHPVRAEDWNERVLPLMRRHRGDPQAFAELCGLAERVVRSSGKTVEELAPDCASAADK